MKRIVNVMHIMEGAFPDQFGAGRRVRTVAAALKLRGHSYVLVTLLPLRGHSSRRLSTESQDGMEVVRIRGLPPPSCAKALRLAAFAIEVTLQLRDLIRTRNVDLILLHNTSFIAGLSAVCLRRLAGTPIVLDLIDVRSEDSKSSSPVRWFEEHLPRFCDLTMATSEDLQMRAMNVKAKRVEYLPPLVDTAMFTPEALPAEPLEAIHKAGWRVIAFSGNGWKEKGLDFLLEAAPIVLSRLRQTKFVLIGGGADDREHYRSEIQKTGLEDSFMICGIVPPESMPHYLAAADVCVAPFPDTPVNRAAGPYKVVEYMSMSKPSVVTDVGDLPRIIRHGHGGLVTSTDGGSIADALLALLEHPDHAAELGRNARVDALERFDVTKCSYAVSEWLESILDRSGERLSASNCLTL